MRSLAAVLVLVSLAACKGIDHRVPAEAEKGIGDTRLAEQSYNAVGNALLGNLRDSYDENLDKDAQLEVLKAADADGKIDAAKVLELIRDNGKTRKQLYAILDQNRAQFEKGKGNFRNAIQVQRSIKSLLDALVERKEAEANAKAAGMDALRTAGKAALTGVGIR